MGATKSGSVPAPGRTSRPPPVSCPSPAPPPINDPATAQRRRQLTTAPPPPEEEEGDVSVEPKRETSAERKRETSVEPKRETPAPAPSAAPKRKRAARTSIRVDEVGEQAITIAARVQTPRLAKGKRDLSSAPIDPRAAFLLAYIDGELTVDDLADITAIPREEVLALLGRMVRLGIVVLS